MRKNAYTIEAKLWIYPGENSNWHFVTAPRSVSAEITKKFGALKRGWGSLPVSVTVGKTFWSTSIFPDRKSGTYLLPVKASVRNAEGLMDGDTVAVRFTVLPSS